MKNLRIENRKYTTEKGLKELEALVNDLSSKLDSDVITVKSDIFYAKCDIGGDTRYEWAFDARWEVNNGKIKLRPVVGEYSECYNYTDIVNRVYKINFSQALKALISVIAEYNTESIKKDNEIKEFLKFCEEYKK